MPYRKTKRTREQVERMKRGKAAARLARPAPDYAPALPNLRRRIIIIDHDFGERRHVIDLYRTDRIDCYRAEADGKPWMLRIGWSRVLAGLRKSLPRISGF